MSTLVLNLSTELRPVPHGTLNSLMLRLEIPTDAVVAFAEAGLSRDCTHVQGTIEGGAVLVTSDGSDPDSAADNGHELPAGFFNMKREALLMTRFIAKVAGVRVKVSQFTMG